MKKIDTLVVAVWSHHNSYHRSAIEQAHQESRCTNKQRCWWLPFSQVSEVWTLVSSRCAPLQGDSVKF